MSRTVKQLERAAVAAHRLGVAWGEFWRRHWREVAKAAGRSPRRRNALVEPPT
jgi:hypothetical protein